MHEGRKDMTRIPPKYSLTFFEARRTMAMRDVALSRTESAVSVAALDRCIRRR